MLRLSDKEYQQLLLKISGKPKLKKKRSKGTPVVTGQLPSGRTTVIKNGEFVWQPKKRK